MFTSKRFLVLGLMFVSNPFQVNFFFFESEIGLQFYSSACDYPVFLTSFIEETMPSPMSILGSLVKCYLTVTARVYL